MKGRQFLVLGKGFARNKKLETYRFKALRFRPQVSILVMVSWKVSELGDLGLVQPYKWSYGPLLITGFLGPTLYFRLRLLFIQEGFFMSLPFFCISSCIFIDLKTFRDV